jgi:hypothetical protein
VVDSNDCGFDRTDTALGNYLIYSETDHLSPTFRVDGSGLGFVYSERWPSAPLGLYNLIEL